MWLLCLGYVGDGSLRSLCQQAQPHRTSSVILSSSAREAERVIGNSRTDIAIGCSGTLSARGRRPWKPKAPNQYHAMQRELPMLHMKHPLHKGLKNTSHLPIFTCSVKMTGQALS